jgi:hypothetical protein
MLMGGPVVFVRMLGCFSAAGSCFMPVVAVVARDASQGKKVKAEYAEEMPHRGKGNGENGK